MTVTTVAILASVGWYVWNSLGADLGEVEVLEKLGGIAKWNVSIAQVGGRRMVQLILDQQGDNREVEIHMFLSATEARLLSQWLRLAATATSPGTPRR